MWPVLLALLACSPSTQGDSGGLGSDSGQIADGGASDGGASDGGASGGGASDGGLVLAGVLVSDLSLAFDQGTLRSWRVGEGGEEQAPVVDLYVFDNGWVTGDPEGRVCHWIGALQEQGPASAVAGDAWASWDVALQLVDTDCTDLVIADKDDPTGQQTLESLTLSLGVGPLHDADEADLQAAYEGAGLTWTDDLASSASAITLEPVTSQPDAGAEPHLRAWGLLYDLDEGGVVAVDGEGDPVLATASGGVQRGMVRGQGLVMLTLGELLER